MRRIVLFDLDGTLTDPAEGIVHGVQFALKSYGIEKVPFDSLLHFIGPPLVDSFEEYLHCTHEEALKAVETYRIYFRNIGIFENCLIAGVPEMLQSLKAAGYELAVASSKPEEFVLRIVEHFHIASYFDAVVGSTMDGSLIKKGDVIRETLRRMQASAATESVDMVGDREHDIFGAKQTLCKPIGVLCGYGSREELEKAGAEEIFNGPAELTEYLLS